MMIQSLEKKYIVIKYSFSDSNVERYICQEETGGEKYTIVRVKNRQWIAKAVEFLMHQRENSHFTDFTSCFFSDECLYVVMRYAEGISLEEKLQNEVSSLEERLAVGKGILERILILNMPDYFLKDCLKAESIILSASLEVSFQYELLNIADYERVQFWQVQSCLLRKISRFGFRNWLAGRSNGTDKRRYKLCWIICRRFPPTGCCRCYRFYNSMWKGIFLLCFLQTEGCQNFFFRYWLVEREGFYRMRLCGLQGKKCFLFLAAGGYQRRYWHRLQRICVVGLLECSTL